MNKIKWFVVSIVSAIETDEAPQNEYPVFEDFYLFSAATQHELDKKIEDRIKIINAGGECRYKEKLAHQKCLGIRKIRSIYNEPPLDIDHDAPSDGTELTHSFFIVETLDDALLLANGKRVNVLYADDD